ncbi:MAG: hypothetical protein QUV19_03620 [Alteromonas macleodii]|uniref:hypothetical protein n=1 Tax=Alteromonas TaxID=226 RepID=UPI0012744D99|nr:hypothetical protein [Alteromonas macleodii]MDM7961202.1 hypothetical protein [Alteromonas macleodii]MDM8169655.1 hypothetical protein [Alteromonas macleodii]CAI3966132.1 hypothetical protein EZ55_03260 [Alteromonas macleodii]VTP57184.1 hypothetical protein EZ55_03260 [Alteromonas macleodii]
MTDAAPQSKYDEIKILKTYITNATKKASTYYKKWSSLFRLWSGLTRGLSLVVAIAAVYLTFAHTDITIVKTYFGSKANASLFLIATTGILVAVDKLFIISGNWKRSTIAKIKIAELEETAEFHWHRINIEYGESGLDAAAIVSVCDFYQAQLVELYKIQTEETTSWGNDIDKAIESFKTVLNTTKERAEAEAKKAAHQATTFETTIVKVKLKNFENVEGNVTITLSGVDYKRKPLDLLVFQAVHVVDGHVIAKITTSTSNEKIFIQENVEKATAGNAVEFEFEFQS